MEELISEARTMMTLWGLWIVKTILFLIVGTLITGAILAPTIRYLKRINLIGRDCD